MDKVSQSIAQEALEFLKSQLPKLCAFATVTAAGRPNCAIMAYAVLEDLTIVCATHTTTRKWINLQTNPKVSLAIGWSFTGKSVQYEGLAELVADGTQYGQLEEMYYQQNPETKRFMNPETAFVRITPIWIRLLDYTSHPPRIIEQRI